MYVVERSPGEGETQVQFLKSVLDAEKPDWHFIQQRKKIEHTCEDAVC